MRAGMIGKAVAAIAVSAPLWGSAILAGSVPLSPAAAQAPATISEAQDLNNAPGVVAEIVQCKRENGVLSIRMRLRNTGTQTKEVDLINGGADYDKYYVTAGNKKYFVLRDSEKNPLANPADNGRVKPKIGKGDSFVWYAKYPAPPAEIKKITYYTPVAPPFEDVPVSE